MKKIYLLVKLIVLICLLLVPNNTEAQLSFSPAIIQSTGYPGGIERFEVNVSNSGNEPLNCTVTTYSTKVVGDGLPIAVEDAPRSCKKWIGVKPKAFRLEPNSGQRIICSVMPPKGTAGGYYAIISCLGVPLSYTDQDNAPGRKAGIRFRYQVQSVVLFTVRGAKIKAIIEPGEPIIEAKKESGGFSVQIPVRNRGNVHDRMSGNVIIKSEDGQLIDRFELVSGRGYVLPEHERLFKTEGAFNLPNGLYVAEINLATGTGGKMRRKYPFLIKDGVANVTDITDEMRAELEGASAGFIIIPSHLTVSFLPGGRRSQIVELRNLTRKRLPLKLMISEWIQDASGTDIVVKAHATHNRSAINWIDLRNSEIELMPLSKRKIPVLVDIPRDADGERYAAITFDRKDIELDASPMGRTRRSVLLRVSAQGTNEPSAQIENFTTSIKTNGVVEFTTQVTNDGNVGFVPEMVFRIMDHLNHEIGTLRATDHQSFIQAGSKGTVAMEWDKILDPGVYHAEMSLRFAPDRPVIVERTSFTIGVNAALKK